MFSYRHAFHAGNHADVLKHAVLIALLKHLAGRDTALMVLDTHAGAGLYRLDGDYANTSGEATNGIFKLLSVNKTDISSSIKALSAASNIAKKGEISSDILSDYIETVLSFNTKGATKPTIYPGSPFIIQRFLQGRDRLKAFEIHPTDSKTLSANLAQLEAGRQIAVLKEDGFEGVKKFLPPPSKRALLMCDPSYEIKSDYARVVAMVTDALKRFPTGTYAVWYPIIPRPEAHDLPRKLKTLANRVGKPFLNVSLTVKSSKLTKTADGEVERPGLPASGMFVINPPFTLKAALEVAMPQIATLLGQDANAAFTIE